MKYKNITKGIFVDRPNRFIANVLIDGKKEVCHVKNTGRCKELLVEGCAVYLEISDNPNRKTKYDVVAVKKGNRLINMDSQIVNYVAIEYLNQMFDNITYVKPEYKYGNSRIDIYLEQNNEKTLIEVKGVTLENNGVVAFPDAPTERGIKHLKELQKAVTEGYKAYIMFVIQMDSVEYFTPNKITHKEFADELKKASENGVNVVAYSCNVTENSISIKDKVKVKL